MRLICVTGQPLGGKTTLARWLAEKLRADYWSSGDFAREQGMDPMETAILKQGVSFALNSKINEEAYRRISAAPPILVMDGFPRTYEQITLVRKLEPLVLFVTISPIVAWSRMGIRGREDDVRSVVIAKTMASLDLLGDLLEEESIRMYMISGDDGESLRQEGLRWCESYLVGSLSGR